MPLVSIVCASLLPAIGRVQVYNWETEFLPEVVDSAVSIFTGQGVRMA